MVSGIFCPAAKESGVVTIITFKQAAFKCEKNKKMKLILISHTQ